MNKFEQYLYRNREVHMYDGKNFLKLCDIFKYLGHDTIKDFQINVSFFNNETYIALEDAWLIITTKYNKNNPKVIQYHKEMGLTNMEYTTTAKALNPVVYTIDRIGSSFKNVGQSIGQSIESKFDMF